MLSKISWSQFLSTISYLLIAYYFTILILYYRKDILKWSRNGIDLNDLSKQNAYADPVDKHSSNASSSKDELRPMSYNEFTVGEEEAKTNYAEVHELMEELKTIFVSSAKKKIIKQELVLAIQHKLHEYAQLKGTEIQNEIVQHIKNECREKCAVDLDRTDLENLWKP